MPYVFNPDLGTFSFEPDDPYAGAPQLPADNYGLPTYAPPEPDYGPSALDLTAGTPVMAPPALDTSYQPDFSQQGPSAIEQTAGPEFDPYSQQGPMLPPTSEAIAYQRDIAATSYPPPQLPEPVQQPSIGFGQRGQAVTEVLKSLVTPNPQPMRYTENPLQALFEGAVPATAIPFAAVGRGAGLMKLGMGAMGADVLATGATAGRAAKGAVRSELGQRALRAMESETGAAINPWQPRQYPAVPLGDVPNPTAAEQFADRVRAAESSMSSAASGRLPIEQEVMLTKLDREGVQSLAKQMAEDADFKGSDASGIEWLKNHLSKEPWEMTADEWSTARSEASKAEINARRSYSAPPDVPAAPAGAAEGSVSDLSVQEATRLREGKPNAGKASASLRKLEKEGYETGDAQDALQSYRDIVRSDFDDAADFADARQEAWDEFVDSLDGIERAVPEGSVSAAPFEGRVYHGSDQEVVIDPAHGGATHGNPTAGWGSFFTPSESEARRFASDLAGGTVVIPAEVRLENPYRMSFAEYDRFVKLDLGGDTTAQMAANTEKAQAFKEKLVAEGYDGIVIGPASSRGRPAEVVAFDKSQIRQQPVASATSPTSPTNAIPDGTKRGFIRSIEESPTYGSNPVLRKLIGIEPDAYYNPITNTQTMADAALRVDTGATEVLARTLAPEPWSDVSQVADALVLLRRSYEDGNTGQLIDVAERIAKEGTAKGQQIQILSQLDDLTPEGLIVQASKDIEKVARGQKGLFAPTVEQAIEGATKRQAGKTRAAAEGVVVKTQKAADTVRKAGADGLNGLVATLKRAADTKVDAHPAMEAAKAKATSSQAYAFITKAVAAGRPVKFSDMIATIRAIAAEETGLARLNPFMRPREPYLSPADAQMYLERALHAKEMPAGAERLAAFKALTDDLEALAKTQAEREAPSVLQRVVRTPAEAEANRIAMAGQKPQFRSFEDLRGQAERLQMEYEALKRAPVGDPAAIKAVLADLNQRAKDLTYMVDTTSRVAKRAVRDIERTTISDVKAALKRGDTGIPRHLAEGWMDRAAALKGIADPYDQMRAAQALMQDVHSLIPMSKVDVALNVLGLPRVLKATWDLSFIARQGIMQAYGRPKEWGAAFAKNIQAFASEEVATAVDRQILMGPFAKARMEAGLEYVDRFGAMAAREETYITGWAGKIPGVKQSERAYITTGNKLRADVFDSTVRGWLPEELRGQTFNSLDELVQATGKSKEDFQRLANWINITTGRGVSGGAAGRFFRSNNQWLNAAFFAPRFAVSRFEVPVTALVDAIRTPSLRVPIARDLGGFMGGTFLMLQLADQIPGVDVEWDPRSSDFGKIRVGPTRLDFLGGFRPIVGLAAQLSTGKKKAESGSLYKVSPLEVLGDFLLTKLAPGVAEIGAQTAGWTPGLSGPSDTQHTPLKAWPHLPLLPKEMQGEWEQRVAHAAMQFLPFLGPDLVNAYKEQGVMGAAIALPTSIFGGSVNTYTSPNDVQDAVAREKYSGKAYADLSPLEKQQVMNDQRVKDKMVELELREMPRRNQDIIRGAFDARDERLKAIEYGDGTASNPGLLAVVNATNGHPSKRLANAIKDAKAALYEAGQTAFTDAFDAAISEGRAPDLKRDLRAAYQAAPVPEDPLTGELDFDARDTARAELLKKAAQAGIEEKYLTEKVSPWEDPKVRAIVEEYDKAMETLRPYYEVRKEVAKSSWVFTIVKQEHDKLAAEALQSEMGQYRLKVYETETPANGGNKFLWQQYEKRVEDKRRLLRTLRQNGIEAAGEKWLDWQPLRRAGTG